MNCVKKSIAKVLSKKERASRRLRLKKLLISLKNIGSAAQYAKKARTRRNSKVDSKRNANIKNVLKKI